MNLHTVISLVLVSAGYSAAASIGSFRNWVLEDLEASRSAPDRINELLEEMSPLAEKRRLRLPVNNRPPPPLPWNKRDDNRLQRDLDKLVELLFQLDDEIKIKRPPPPLPKDRIQPFSSEIESPNLSSSVEKWSAPLPLPWHKRNDTHSSSMGELKKLVGILKDYLRAKNNPY